MRVILAVLVTLIAGSTVNAAPSDSYPWCAEYDGSLGGAAKNCSFATLQQCQWAISGNGGFCQRNPFSIGAYDDGRPPAGRPKKRSGPRY